MTRLYSEKSSQIRVKTRCFRNPLVTAQSNYLKLVNDKRTYEVLASVKKARFYVVLLIMLSVSMAGGGQNPFKDDHSCLNVISVV